MWISEQSTGWGGIQFTLCKMRDHVAHWVCGFLNSQQGGMILIGITEKGKLTPDTRNSRDHVAHCVCGFLNSQQSGMVLIGITEEGWYMMP